jgi:hypothetical protein
MTISFKKAEVERILTLIYAELQSYPKHIKEEHEWIKYMLMQSIIKKIERRKNDG